MTIVDLLGRALKFIREMPIEPTAAVWGALLGACRMHKNMELGAYAAEHVFELDPYDSGPMCYSLISMPLLKDGVMLLK